MMRLAIFNHLEARIWGRSHDRTRHRFPSVKFEEAPKPERWEIPLHDVIDFRLQIGARAKVRTSGPQSITDIDEAKRRVLMMLCRELFGDMTQELHRLYDYAFREGYDEDILKRIARLIDLSRGEEVDDA
jgi:hypothetical protein